MSVVKSAIAALAVVTLGLTGCYEKKADIKTPIGDVEVTENKATGETSVEVNVGGSEE